MEDMNYDQCESITAIYESTIFKDRMYYSIGYYSADVCDAKTLHLVFS
jgi:hypothetical protein